MSRRQSLAAVVVMVALAATGCGSSSGSSTSASSAPCPRDTGPDAPGVVLPICPRPPRSAIPAARARLRRTLAEVKDPDLPAVVIRRLELLVDVMYQAGRCGEHEIQECDYERWDRLAAKIFRQVISHGYEEEVRGLRRVLIEEGFHDQAARHGPRSIEARTWGWRLLHLEEKGAGQCRGIPTCDYRKLEAAATKLRREMGLAKPAENRRPAVCASNELAVHPGRESARADGTVHTRFLVVVYSPYPCTLAGVPAVTALARGGRAVEAGRPVPRSGPTDRRGTRVVTLGSGRPAHFLVAYDDGTSYPRCRSAQTGAFRVRLPGVRRPMVVTWRAHYCPPPEGDLGLRVGRIE